MRWKLHLVPLLALLHCAMHASAVVYPRVELRTMMNEPKYQKQKDIFIQALNGMMDMDPESMYSWYQIAGIHGIPGVAYDRSENVTTPFQQRMFNRWMGYCEHDSTIFPTWHRPYMLLMERGLAIQAITIAMKYRSSADYIAYMEAAAQLRLPYYDWGLNAAVPDVLLSKTIVVYSPDGWRSVRNPLFSYKLQKLVMPPPELMYPNSFPYTMPVGTETVRWPRVVNGVISTDTEAVRTSMETLYGKLRSKTLDLLYVDSWQCFASITGQKTSPNCLFQSLEQLHNWGHAKGAGDGHFGVLETAGFDPLFYLHHSNVDRMFALWQALRPDLKVTPGASVMGSYVYDAGTVVNEDTPLYPFRQIPGSNSPFLTSKTVMDIESLGYTYPELMGKPSRTDLYNNLLKLYGQPTKGFRWYLFLNCTANLRQDQVHLLGVTTRVAAAVSAGTFNRWLTVETAPELFMSTYFPSQMDPLERARIVQAKVYWNNELTEALQTAGLATYVPAVDESNYRRGPAFVPFGQSNIMSTCFLIDPATFTGTAISGCTCSRTLSWSYDGASPASPSYVDIASGIISNWT